MVDILELKMYDYKYPIGNKISNLKGESINERTRTSSGH